MEPLFNSNTPDRSQLSTNQHLRIELPVSSFLLLWVKCVFQLCFSPNYFLLRSNQMQGELAPSQHYCFVFHQLVRSEKMICTLSYAYKISTYVYTKIYVCSFCVEPLSATTNPSPYGCYLIVNYLPTWCSWIKKRFMFPVTWKFFP